MQTIDTVCQIRSTSRRPWTLGDPFSLSVTRGISGLEPVIESDGHAYLTYSGPGLLGTVLEGRSHNAPCSFVASFNLRRRMPETEHADLLRCHGKDYLLRWHTPIRYSIQWHKTKANYPCRAIHIQIGVKRTRALWEDIGDPRTEAKWLAEAVFPRLCPASVHRFDPFTFQVLVAL